MSFVNLPPLPRDSTFCDRFRRQCRLLILLSENNPRSIHFYENRTTIAKMKLRQIVAGSKTIHCFSLFNVYYQIWMGLIFIMCLVHHPVQAAFSRVYTKKIHYFKLFLDVFCLIDIGVRFRSGYIDQADRKVIMSQSMIAKHYLQTYFVFDLLSSIPDPHIFFHERPYFHIITTLSFLKLARAVTAYNYIVRTAQFFHIDRPTLRLLFLVCCFFLMVHWIACIIYILPHVRNHITGIYSTSWIFEYNESKLSPWAIYVRCFYRATAYVFCIKRGSLHEQGWEENILASICYLIGTIFSYTISVRICVWLLGLWNLEIKYHAMLGELVGFMSRKFLPQTLHNRILAYYNYRFRGKYFEANTIKSFLSESLQKQVKENVLERLTTNVEIFWDLPQETIQKIIKDLQGEIFLPQDLIVKAGTEGDCMYFISSGTVAVYTISGKEICHLHDGEYFGEIPLVFRDQKQVVNVYAVEICEVYKLSKHGFKTCLRNNKTVMSKLVAEAVQRTTTANLYEDVQKSLLEML